MWGEEKTPKLDRISQITQIKRAVRRCSAWGWDDPKIVAVLWLQALQYYSSTNTAGSDSIPKRAWFILSPASWWWISVQAFAWIPELLQQHARCFICPTSFSFLDAHVIFSWFFSHQSRSWESHCTFFRAEKHTQDPHFGGKTAAMRICRET